MIKNHNRAAFTLLETLLAFALSSFIIFALMQSYRALVRFVENAREIASTNQRLAIITQLIERDLTCACMPQLHPLVQSNKEKGLSNDQPQVEQPQEQEKQVPENEKKAQEEKRLEERKKYFFSQVNDADFHRFKGKKVELLSACNFITTNALEFYGEASPRWVRVKYELIKQKKSAVESYTLIRKQSTDIHNTKMKISEVDPVANLNDPITVHEVMQGIKGLFIEFSMLKEPEKKENESDVNKKPEPELIKAFAWGESKKTMGQFPQRAHVYLELWNENQTKTEKIELELYIFAVDDVVKILADAKKQQKSTQQSPNQSPVVIQGNGVLAELMRKAQGEPDNDGKQPNPVDAIFNAIDSIS